jgi:hypothetical protein
MMNQQLAASRTLISMNVMVPKRYLFWNNPGTPARKTKATE